MVLRSGVIIPFQFRDTKKLLQVGVPEENRNLSIFDLKNVVRAAFGIYNFEFRNKKIGFNIPDELLLHYLAQRHDLTNFVIEIGQDVKSNANLDAKSDQLSYEPSCSQLNPKLNNVPLLSHHKLSDCNSNNDYGSADVATTIEMSATHAHNSPSDHSNSQEPPHKIRIAQVYSEQAAESMTQSIDPMDIIPKPEQDEHEEHEGSTRLLVPSERAQMMQMQLQQQQHHAQQVASVPNFFPTNYVHGHAMLGNNPLQQSMSPNVPHAAVSTATNRFRRRGERMSKDQKELYVKYFEENPCMLSQRRNDHLLEPHWNKLASLLNSVSQGAVKNVEEWKQTFDAWRYRVFMYHRYNSKLSGAAAQNPKNYKPLTNTDQKAYAMWTSHKANVSTQDYDKMDMFSNLDETQGGDYDY